MDKIEWFTRVAVYRGKDAPFDQPFVKGSAIYASDSLCVLRSQFDDPAVAEEFSSEGMKLDSFWKNLKIAYKNLVPIGKIDALLLKDMAGTPVWGKETEESRRIIRLDGAFFHAGTIATALAGWDEPEAKLSRVVSEELELFHGKKGARKKVEANSVGNSPIFLSGAEVQVFILPFAADGDAFDLDFPESALLRE